MNDLILEIEYFRAWKKKNPVIYIGSETIKQLEKAAGLSGISEYCGCRIIVLENEEYGFILR